MIHNARILLTLIIDYLNTANVANALLSEQLNGNPFELWKNRLVPQKGGCNGLFYFFHGVGCKIETTEFNVDFDYCSDGSIQHLTSGLFKNIRVRKFQLVLNKDFLKLTPIL